MDAIEDFAQQMENPSLQGDHPPADERGGEKSVLGAMDFTSAFDARYLVQSYGTRGSSVTSD